MSRRLMMGLVGGGPGSFIGPVHRMAAELDGNIQLVAGAFSSDAEKSRVAGTRYGIDADRSYADYRAMFATESARADGIDFVAIATPNHLHFQIARAALESGLHVMSDKPVTATLAEALTLREIVEASGKRYGVTFVYSGYAMVREARALVAAGEIGAVRKVVVDYPQGWLSQPIERTGSKQAVWRADPAQAGPGGCIGDIGVHAFHLAEFVSQLRVEGFVADLSTVVAGRALDDDCNVLLRFAGGQPGVLSASQIATGERNGITLRIYGEQGHLMWSHESPGALMLGRANGSTEIRHAGSAGNARHARLPAGHPEGFIEAFANLYRDFGSLIRGEMTARECLLPGIDDGVRSMRFVEKAVAASRARAGWTTLEGARGS